EARFSGATAPGVETQWGTITAAYNGTAKRASLVVRPLGPPQIAVNPGQVIGGQTATGQVTIPCPAGPSGLLIPLSSSSPSATVPVSVTVPAGATTVAFPIGTSKVP